MVIDVVIHDPQQHYAKGTFVLEATPKAVLCSRFGEVSVGASLSHLYHRACDILEMLKPEGGLTQAN